MDVLAKGRALRSARRRRTLGVSLHLIYCRLSLAIVTGQQILESLQSFAADPGQLSFDGSPHIVTGGIWLEDLLDRQRQNLLDLEDSVGDYARQLSVIDASLAANLLQFTAFKGVGLALLARLLGRGEIPMSGPDRETVEHLTRVSDHVLDEIAPDKAKNSNFFGWYAQLAEISGNVHGGCIEWKCLFQDTKEPMGSINPAQILALQRALSKNDLYIHLEDARSQMRKLKSFIEQNFDLPDIMLGISDEAWKRRPGLF